LIVENDTKHYEQKHMKSPSAEYHGAEPTGYNRTGEVTCDSQEEINGTTLCSVNDISEFVLSKFADFTISHRRRSKLNTPKERSCRKETEVDDKRNFSSFSSFSNSRTRRHKRKDTKCFESADDENRKLPDLIRENIDLLKYYKKRYKLFSKYDEGIQLDKGMYLRPFLIKDEDFPHTHALVIIIYFLQRAGIP